MTDAAPPPAPAPGKKIPGELPPDRYTVEKVTWIAPVADHLFSFRITRSPGFRFIPGQFARLGVYRDDGAAGPRFVWRAYSIVSADYDEFLEFYSIVVPDGDFTTRLAALAVGDEILVEKTSYGFLTTDRFENGRDLWLLSSGTGLAPFLSILHDPQIWKQYERIVVVHSVRHANELAYRAAIESLRTQPYFADFFVDRPDKLVYVPLVTREPHGDCLGERITQALDDGRLEEKAGLKLSPERSRVMICGNPEMVEDVRGKLQAKGYSVSRRGHPGNLAVENYW